ncbi:hypothetical protein NL108_013572 [Boleophthalmus pectinirostris]|nr:hypothetical protein NL108_013572 [Boleophthalmus pectinirostris]
MLFQYSSRKSVFKKVYYSSIFFMFLPNAVVYSISIDKITLFVTLSTVFSNTGLVFKHILLDQNFSRGNSRIVLNIMLMVRLRTHFNMNRANHFCLYLEYCRV